MSTRDRARRAAARRWLSMMMVVVAVSACDGSQTEKPRDAPSNPADSAAPPDTSVPDAPPDTSVPDGSNGFACDPVDQTGCAAGQKCDIAATGSFACVPDGDLGEFRACTPAKPSACASGLSCRDTNFGDNRCARLCNADRQCRADETCSSTRVTADGQQYRMCATRQECNPLLDDCMDTANTCTYVPTGIPGTGSFCVSPGPVGDGQPCGQGNMPLCQRGSACLNTGSGARCFKLCDPAGGSPACTTGVDCTMLTTVGPVNVGACGL